MTTFVGGPFHTRCLSGSFDILGDSENAMALLWSGKSHRVRKRGLAGSRPAARGAQERPLQCECLESRLCLTVIPGFYGAVAVTSHSEVYRLDADLDAETITPRHLGTLKTGAAIAREGRDVALLANGPGGQLFTVSNGNQRRGLPSSLRVSDFDMFNVDQSPSTPIQVTTLGALWFPQQQGQNVNAWANALEWMPAPEGHDSTLIAAGFIGPPLFTGYDTNSIFIINTDTLQVQGIFDLKAIGRSSAGDLAFDFDGNVYLSIDNGDVLELQLTTPGRPYIIHDLPAGTPPFEGLIPVEPGVSLVGIAADRRYYAIDLAANTAELLGTLEHSDPLLLDSNELVRGASISYDAPIDLGVVTGTVNQVNVQPRFGQLWYQLRAGSEGILSVSASDGATAGTSMKLYESLDGDPLAVGGSTVEARVAPGQALWLYVDGLAYGQTADLQFTTTASAPPPLPQARMDVTLGLSPKNTNPTTGEVNALPANAEWIDEWDAHVVEIWLRNTGAGGAGVARGSFTLNYNTAYFTATNVQPGPAFSEAFQYINDAAGQVSFGATTSRTDLGDDRPVLLARVEFRSTELDPGVPLNADGHYAQPADDFHHSIDAAYVELVDLQNGRPTIGDMPDTVAWPVLYDVDEDQQLTLGDVSYLAVAFDDEVTGSQASPFAYATDFDGDGFVTLGDLSFLAANFSNNRTDDQRLIYPPHFPNNWPPQPQLLRLDVNPLPPGTAAPLTGEQVQPVIVEAVSRLERSKGEGSAAALAGVSFEIVDLPDNIVGRVTEDRIVQIDVDAAGHGWFVDTTPWESAEFSPSVQQGDLAATASSPAYSRADLMTVVLHELGHVLGDDHEDVGIMDDILPLGTRRLPP